MSEETEKSNSKPTKAEKEDRLKAALRANLKRRKSAVRKAKAKKESED
tara:strand:+ start:2316 stop:2459 length:144 start_codon:yes stop_codon:yes gene_type:complete